MKILMVCLGNICRSPMAEGILQHKINTQKLNFSVDSAGTSNFHVGDAPDKRAIQKMKSYKIDISHLRGRQFTVNDFNHFDLILAMDESNQQNILALARNENDKRKVKLMLDYFPTSDLTSVPDPYYGGDDGFENVYQLLNEACNNLISGFEK
jgi:protein-tyrosine phosphatase